MRVGVYIDGFNVYYGARGLCGKASRGWRWIDFRALVDSKMPVAWRNSGASIERVVYCTAKVIGDGDPDAPYRQDTYIRALVAHGSVDHVEYGTFVSQVRSSPLAVRGSKRGRPQIVESGWPVMIHDANRDDVPSAHFIVSHLHREEKGSDVNVASHLLLDVLTGRVDAAIVVSNDSDLEMPLRASREHVPVGLINPSSRYLAGKLRGAITDGVGNHWWGQIDESEFRGNQMPDPVGTIHKPVGW